MTLEVPPNFNRIPLPLLTINKLALLEKSTNTPPFYILIEGTNVINDVVFYDIELCLQDDKNAVLNRITRRFSQIEKFHQAIKKVLEPKIKLPKLPPKKIFGTTNADFIKERKDALQAYFNFYPTVQRIVFVEIYWAASFTNAHCLIYCLDFCLFPHSYGRRQSCASDGARRCIR